MNASRRSGLLTGFTLLGLALPIFFARPAMAEHRTLYVDAAAAENGDGSRHRPFWRITDAVERARALRQEDSRHEERIVIHVLPGIYAGTFDSTHLADNPKLEPLPIIVNVSGLRLEGETQFDEDADGVPGGTSSPDSETVLTVTDDEHDILSRGRSVLLIATTADGMAGNHVSVSGFVVDGRSQDVPGAVGFDIFADRVSGLHVHHNLLRHAGGGVATRLASGTVEANVCTANNNIGIFITGGPRAHPPSMTLRRNRST